MTMRLLALTLLFAVLVCGGDLLLIVHKGDDSFGFYDAVTGKLETKVAVGKRPHEFAVSPDERFAYVTNYGADSYTEEQHGGNTISIVDLKERKNAGEIDLGEYHRPHGIERGKSGLYYVTTDFPAALLMVDVKKRKVASAIKLTSKLPHMLQLTRDQRKAWTADAGSGTVTIIDLANKRQFAQIEVGGVPMGLALSADEKSLYVATRSNNMVVLVDAVANKLRRNIGVQGMASRLALSPDNKRLYASLIGSGEVAAIDTETLLEVKRVASGTRSEGILMGPGGSALYVSAQGDNKVVKFALPGLERVQTIETPARPDPLYVLRGR